MKKITNLSIGEVLFKEDSLDRVYGSFTRNDADLMYSRELAFSRLNTTFNRDVEKLLCNDEFVVKEGWLCDPKRDIYAWIRDSIILSDGNVKNLVDQNKKRHPIYLDKDFDVLEFIKNNSIDSLILGESRSIKISDMIKGQSRRASWLYGNEAPNMGERFANNFVKELSIIVPYSNGTKLPYCTQIVMSEVNRIDPFIGYSHSLHDERRTVGIKRHISN